jgi:predicted helicase
VEYHEVHPSAPLLLFRSEDTVLRGEYNAGVSLTDLLPLNSTGVKTHRDKFCIDFELSALKSRIEDLVSRDLSDSEIRQKYALEDTHGWSLKTCRERLRADTDWERAFAHVLYRPFDWRPIYFSPHVVELARMEVSQNFLGRGNLGLVFMRQVATDEGYTHFAVTRDPTDNRCFYSNRGTMSFAPLWVDSTPADGGFLKDTALGARIPNIGAEAVRLLAGSFEPADKAGVTPEAVMAYSYAVFHSIQYRERYFQFLTTDFPRVPLPGSFALFQSLGCQGQKLVDLHLMESCDLTKFTTTYTGPKDPEVARVGWSNDTVWLDAGKTNARQGHRATKPGTIGFYGVPEEVWDFHVGGYQVCHKWLKDRKGHKLSENDLAHYQKIVVALNETIRIMAEIDEVIEAHGGWPGAFVD